MKLLIIGGTGFLGRHLTALALDWGHEVTLFNRGLHQHPDWRDLLQLTGDRDKSLSALQGTGLQWDLVIDTCCYRPEQAASLSAALFGRCERLIFISTISVYRDFSLPGMDESAPLHAIPAGEMPSDYGPLKVLCEAEYHARWGDRLCILRPGVLCGSHDPTGRMAWWIKRVQQGGPWLLPGSGEDRLQYLDVRDCAEFVLRAAEQQLSGPACCQSAPSSPSGCHGRPLWRPVSSPGRAIPPCCPARRRSLPVTALSVPRRPSSRG